METVMSVWQLFVRRKERELAESREDLERLQSGTVRYGEQHLGGPMVDVTQREIEWHKRTIVIYENLIAQIRTEHGV